MFSPFLVSMHGQVIKSELEREIKKYQMLNAASVKETSQSPRYLRSTQLYRIIRGKVRMLANSKRNEIKIAECAQ